METLFHCQYHSDSHNLPDKIYGLTSFVDHKKFYESSFAGVCRYIMCENYWRWLHIKMKKSQQNLLWRLTLEESLSEINMNHK